MLSDAEIADQLDEILANPESDDEFFDEIDTGYDDDGMYFLWFLYNMYASCFTYIYKYIIT